MVKRTGFDSWEVAVTRGDALNVDMVAESKRYNRAGRIYYPSGGR